MLIIQVTCTHSLLHYHTVSVIKLPSPNLTFFKKSIQNIKTEESRDASSLLPTIPGELTTFWRPLMSWKPNTPARSYQEEKEGVRPRPLEILLKEEALFCFGK